MAEEKYTEIAKQYNVLRDADYTGSTGWKTAKQAWHANEMEEAVELAKSYLQQQGANGENIQSVSEPMYKLLLKAFDVNADAVDHPHRYHRIFDGLTRTFLTMKHADVDAHSVGWEQVKSALNSSPSHHMLEAYAGLLQTAATELDRAQGHDGAAIG